MYVNHMQSHTHHNVWARCALPYLQSAGYLATVARDITTFMRQCIKMTMFIVIARLFDWRAAVMSERDYHQPC